MALESELEELKRDLSADRDRDGDRKSPVAEARRSSQVLTPRRWWEIHQLAVSSTYVLMMYPVWRVRSWLPPPAGMLFLFAVLSCAVVGTSLRLHLWFTARYYATELLAQRARALPWIRWCDAGFAASLFLAALAIGNQHSAVGTLLITVSIAVTVASFMIEPTTTRAAFHSRSNDAQTPPRHRR